MKELLNNLFYEKRTVNQFKDIPLSEDILKQLYELTSLGATAFNAQPARFVFIQSQEGKERLKPYLMPGNLDKTMKAPLTVIVATDFEFYNLLDKTFPVADVKGLFVGNDQLIQATGFRNSSLAGGYLIKSAHALGLDAGPMSGFDNAGVDKEFFAGTAIQSNFLVNIGYGDYNNIPSRLPRLSFEEAVRLV